MKRTFYISLAALALATAAPVAASAADLSVSVNRPNMTRVDYDGPRHRHGHWRDGPRFGVYIGGDGRSGNRCGYWRDECGERHGYGSWRYDRCLARRDC